MQTDPHDYNPIRPQELPYLKFEALEGRPIPLHTFHDGNQWHLWFPMENGLLQPIRIVDAVEMVYLAPRRVRNSDACLLFIDFIYKCVEVRHTRSFIAALTSDVFNLGASLRKLDLLRALRDVDGKSRLVATELEYLFLLCRSMFDLLQEIVSRIWDTVQLLDTSIKKQRLPSSFRKVVLYQETIQSSINIQERFGLPPTLADWYAECAPFFCRLRDVRDAIIHKPVQEPLIYVEDNGFSIEVDSPPFREVMHWPEHVLQGRIGPLNFFVAHFVHETLAACENFVEAVTKQIRFSPDFAPGYAFFLRSPHMASLQGIRRILDEDPWAEFTLTEDYWAKQHVPEGS